LTQYQNNERYNITRKTYPKCPLILNLTAQIQVHLSNQQTITISRQTLESRKSLKTTSNNKAV